MLEKIKKVPSQISTALQDINTARGTCVECNSKVNQNERKQHKAYKLVLKPDQVNFEENMVIEGGVERIRETMKNKGLSLSQSFTAIVLDSEAKVTNTAGSELNMPLCCQTCGMTMYSDFIKTRRPITYVKLIGYKNSGKTCFCASVFNKYSYMMYPDTVERMYFEDVRNLILNGQAPEPTPDSMISSPILLVKFNSNYIGIKDVPGENIALTAASIKKGDVVALVVNIEDETTITKIIDKVIPQINNDVSKIVICISQIDKLSECNNIMKNIVNKAFGIIGIDRITKQFYKKLCSNKNSNFSILYKACVDTVGKQKVCIIGHAALGTEVDADGKFKDDYNPMYIDETLKTFIGG